MSWFISKEMRVKRAIILVMDSFGIGAAPDADKFGDVGSNTFAHIASACYRGEGNENGLRNGPLEIPNLTRLGLNAAEMALTGKPAEGVPTDVEIEGAYGYASEISFGKDTPSGHWEMCGVPALFDWTVFPKEYPSFPKELMDAFVKEANLPGVLGNKAASGTEIIQEFGDEHVASGKPIVYTSADSVLQIAVHEEAFGLERLYEICKIARKLIDKYNVGRVIARPFTGKSGHYERTVNRHDYSVPPTAPTLLDKLKASGGEVIGIGKIPDIFAHLGLTKEVVAHGNDEIFDKTIEETKDAGDRSFIFANFVDFDMLFGHRRTVSGYADAIEKFDERLPEFEKLLKPGDIAIIIADHGCDPTFEGTDHTREYVPIIVFGPDIKPGFIGARDTFADVGQTLAEYFGLESFKYGKSFLKDVLK